MIVPENGRIKIGHTTYRGGDVVPDAFVKEKTEKKTAIKTAPGKDGKDGDTDR